MLLNMIDGICANEENIYSLQYVGGGLKSLGGILLEEKMASWDNGKRLESKEGLNC